MAAGASAIRLPQIPPFRQGPRKGPEPGSFACTSAPVPSRATHMPRRGELRPKERREVVGENEEDRRSRWCETVPRVESEPRAMISRCELPLAPGPHQL